MNVGSKILDKSPVLLSQAGRDNDKTTNDLNGQ